MTSQSDSQIIVIHILPNISRNKDNQAIKPAQLTGCNIRNIFLEKPYTKEGEETNPRLFSEKLKLAIFLDLCSKVLYNLFLLYGNLRAVQIY